MSERSELISWLPATPHNGLAGEGQKRMLKEGTV